MIVPINITGGSYKHKSLPISAQVTRNFWPQLIDDPFVKDKYILEGFVGQKLFGNTGNTGRGIFYHNSLLYHVAGTNLYSVSSVGVHTSLGTIPGTERCIFNALGTDIIIVTERRAFIWNGSTVSEVTDSDLESPDSVAVLNNQAIYDGDNDRFGVSDVGDASSINGLNYATAESRADNLVRCYDYNQIVYMMGERTIELWWNSGVGRPPFDRIQGGIVEKGLAALHSVANNDNFLYFLGDDRQVYALQGSSITKASDQALAIAFASYSVVDDAIGWCMTLRDQNFYVLTFPTANKTWVYVEGGQWFEWSSGVAGGRNVANSYAFAYDKHIVEDYQNGNLYELDFDTYTENGNTIIRQRDTGVISATSLGAAGKKITMNKFTLNIEAGVGLISGQGSNPMVMLSYSDDGGKTFSTERWATIGKQGDFKHRIEWNVLGSFYERIIRIRASDPVYYAIRGAEADLEVGI